MKKIHDKILLLHASRWCAYLGALMLGLTSCSGADEPEAVTDSETPVAFAVKTEDNWNASRAAFENDSQIGIFAYHVPSGESETSTPNFMNNQMAEYNGTSWDYSPIKYWPNNQGDVINFYAYAPYGSYTISADKKITYDASSNTDLLWNAAETKNQNKESGTIAFHFKHALAKIGFTVKKSGTGINNATIAVKKVMLSTSDCTGDENVAPNGPFYTTGILNLAKQGTPVADVVADWTASTTGRGFFLNHSNFNNATEEAGFTVTATADPAQKLNKEESDILVIPQNTTFNLFVQYTVELSSGHSYTNNFNKTMSAINFQAGKVYTINLNLGVNNLTVGGITITDFKDAIGGYDNELEGEL